MRYLIFAGLIGIVSISSTALAGSSPHPTAQDADGDGYSVATVDVNGDSAKDAKDIGVKASAYDCDDKHKVRNPGATEVVADGIDQDCSGQDLVLPVGDAEWRRFVADEYRGRTPSAKVFVAEYDRIKAAGSRASIDSVAGRFEIADPNVDTFRDVYIGTSKVLGADGIREVVTIEEASHFRGGSASGGGSGISTKTATKIADAAVKKEKDERLTWQTARESEIGTITEAVNAHGTLLDAVAAAIEAKDTASKAADAAEKERAEEAEADLRRLATKALSAADGAVSTANSLASHGPLIEGYALAGTMIGAQIVDDDYVARNVIGGGAGVGFNVGADIDAGRVNAFVDAIFGADGGASLAHSEAVGLEVVGENGWGGFAAYSVRSSQPNSLETEVLGRNPLIGVSFVRTFAENNASHGLFQVRAGVGPEFIGMSGKEVKDRVGLAGRLTISIGGGIGAMQQ